MSNTKQISHSPAPWRAIGAAIIADDGKQVAATYPSDAFGDPIRSMEEDDTNLFLICAAPALKAALEKYNNAMDDLFRQCLSNKISNFKGDPVDCSYINAAKLEGEQALALANNK